jgi:ribonuclease P protein component
MQRLKTRTQFQAVLAGATAARTVHFALHSVLLDNLVASQEIALGAMVPKRWAKRAVTRNAIKRQIYSVSADFESTLSVAAHLVRLRSSFDSTQFPSATSDGLKAAVRHELQQLFSVAVDHSVLATKQVAVE